MWYGLPEPDGAGHWEESVNIQAMQLSQLHEIRQLAFFNSFGN